MSYIKQIEPDEASPDILRMYRGIEKQRGLIFNNWKLLAHSPHTLRGYSQMIGHIVNPQYIEKRMSELVILKTSLINQPEFNYQVQQQVND